MKIANAIVIFVFVLAGAISQPSSTQAQSICECVGYAVKMLFNGPRGGNWPTAASMAKDDYWGNQQIKKEGKARVRSRTAAPGDVIIMQPNARIEVLIPGTNQWDRLGYNKVDGTTNIGGGAGHIGFVVSARYDKAGYWDILMKSANFGYGKGDPEGGCSNVAIDRIRVYNGPATSFWRPA